MKRSCWYEELGSPEAHVEVHTASAVLVATSMGAAEETTWRLAKEAVAVVTALREEAESVLIDSCSLLRRRGRKANSRRTRTRRGPSGRSRR